jgi:1-acyl-sn-glycerol-3-phosphate acyltransferase
LKEGDCVAITPDGPRGPAMKVGIGIVNAARLAEVPIVPITYATSRRRILPSWDHFHVALPFGRGIFLWGEPIEISPDSGEAELKQARALLEERMVEMVREADRRVGHEAAMFCSTQAPQLPSAWPRKSSLVQGEGGGEGPSPHRAVPQEKYR